MSNQIKHLSPEMAKSFLDREWRLGKSIGILTGLFFLVYCPGIILRKVGIICKPFFSPNLYIFIVLSVQNLSYFVFYLIQIDPTARITSPSATIICYCFNLAIGVIDPMVYLTRRKQYREEIKSLIWSASPMRAPTEVKSRCKTTGWK